MFKVLRDEPYFTMKVTPNVFLNLILLAHEGNFFVHIDIFFGTVPSVQASSMAFACQ